MKSRAKVVENAIMGYVIQRLPGSEPTNGVLAQWVCSGRQERVN